MDDFRWRGGMDLRGVQCVESGEFSGTLAILETVTQAFWDFPAVLVGAGSINSTSGCPCVFIGEIDFLVADTVDLPGLTSLELIG